MGRWTALGATGVLGATVTVASLFAAGGAQAPVEARADVSGFRSCDELQQWYLRGRAERLRLQPEAIGMGARASTDVVPANSATGTNVQEAGVDEADIAKTDGRLAVVVHGRWLRTYDVTGSVPRLLGALALGPVSSAELLLVGDRAVVVSRDATRILTQTLPDDPRNGTSSRFAPPRHLADVTTISTVDLRTPTSPVVVRTQTVDGAPLSVRERNGTVRIVLRDEEWPRDDVLTAEDWIPTLRDGSDAPRPLVPCTDVRHPRVSSGAGTVAVLTLDPADPAALRSEVLATSGTVAYSSADRIYVAATDPRWQGGLGPATTHLHAFRLGATDAEYVGSGTVPGVVANRWALSEYDGRLRVASTLQDDFRAASTRVSVLQERADALVTVGSVGGIGPGEDVEAVRWFGDHAVVVTFRRTDPLHTLDLSDPARPVVVGELRLPGFSSYLHPVGSDLVLGVGQDATALGQTTGTQVSTFDLRSPAAPRRVAALALGGDSPVGGDARTFGYLPVRRLALVPVRHGAQAFFAVVRIGRDGTLTRRRDVPLSGTAGVAARVLPLGGDRVAVVDSGAVREVLALDQP